MKNYLLLFLMVFFLGWSSCGPKENKNENITDKVKDTSEAGIKLSALNEKIAASPTDASLLHERAKIFIDQKNYESALADMNAVLAIDTTKSAYFLTMADISFAANQTFKAKEFLEKAIALDPENTDAMMRLAELNLIVRQYGKSVELLTKILEKDKLNTTAWLMRGINFKENGDTVRAVNDFRSAVEADPNYYEAYMQLGIIYQAKNNPIAEGYYSNALKIRPRSEEALYGRGLWYQEHDQIDKAIQDYTSIIQINPAYKYAHFNLGYIHHIILKVYPEALKHYTKAINADPKYAEAYYNRGLCHEFMGNLQDAKTDFKYALTIRPVYPPAEEGFKRVSK